MSTSRLPWLIGMVAILLVYAAGPVSGQGFLRRLEDQVRQRLEEGPILPPPPPDSSAVQAGESETIPPDPSAESDRSQGGGGRLGITVEDPRSTRGRTLTRGARVVEVTPGAPAEEAGLQVGDMIVALDGTLIPDAESLILQMRQTRPGQRIDLQYIRGQQLGRVKVTLAGPDIFPATRSDDPASDEPSSRGETPSPKANDAKIPPNQAGESGLGALGSALGGLFGGDQAARKTEPPAPAPSGPEPSAPGNAEVLPSLNRDSPPSLAKPERENASSAELQETVRRLEATNRRLESRLRQLEERMESLLQSAEGEE